MKYKDTLNAKGAVNELLPEGKTLEEIQAEQWGRMMKALEDMDASVGADDFLQWARELLLFQGVINPINDDSTGKRLLNDQGVQEFFDAHKQISEAVMQELHEALGIMDVRTSIENMLVDPLSDGIVKQKLMKILSTGSWLGAVASGIVPIIHGLWHAFADSLEPIGVFKHPFTWECAKIGAAFVAIGVGAAWMNKKKQEGIDTIVDAAILQVIDEMRTERAKADAAVGVGAVLVKKKEQKGIDTIVDATIFQVINEMRAQRDKAAAEAKIDTAGASQGQS